MLAPYDMNIRALNANFDGSTDADLPLDVQLASSSRELLQQRIRFVEAKRPDSHYEELKKRYKPINDPVKEKSASFSSSFAHNRIDSGRKSDGVGEPRVELFPTERIEMQWKAPRRVGAGLANLGNTCFLNSVLQCLSYTAPLFNYLQSGEHSRQCRMVGFCAMCEVKRHVDVVLSAHGKVVRPMGIVQRLKNIAKHFRVGRQEDAHEFLRYLIDGMQKSCLTGYSKLDSVSQGTSLVHRIFGGYHRSQVKCLKCRSESNTYELLLDISLNIKSCLSVKRALEKFIEPEMLDGINRYFCSKCKQKVPAQKRLTVHRAPNVLTLQMKRFEFYSLCGSKLSKEVKYDEKLDLRPFMSCQQGPPEIYQLYAVLVHAGSSCNSGHYYCFVRSPAGHWFCMNDAQVYQVSISTVLGQQAYLLFYSRMKPRHETPVAVKTAMIKPIQPASRHFIGPVKPDAKSATAETGKLSGTQTNLRLTSFQKTTPGSLSFTPQSLRTADIKCQTSSSEKDASKVKMGSVSLQNIQKPTAVVPPNPVVSPVRTKAHSEMANSVKVVIHSPIESAANLATVKPTGSPPKRQESRHDKGNALGLLSGYESSDSDKSPSPARIAPATSTTSDGHPTSPDEQQEKEITSQGNSSDDIPEGPEPPVESSVREADQSSESHLDKCTKEKTPTKDKKKKKKHKKDRKSEKEKNKHVKGERERHGVLEHSSGDSKHKHYHSDSSVVRGSRKRHISSGDSTSDVSQPPHKEARTSEERHHKHRHRHHSLSSDSNDQVDRDDLDSVRSHHGRCRSQNSVEASERYRRRGSDSIETSERHKSKKEKHHYVPSSPERTHSDRCFERGSAEKIRWEDTGRMRDSHVSSSCTRWDGQSHNHALSELTKSSLHGYGRSVQSWDGGQSLVDRAVDEDQRHGKRNRDPWDDEYDKGKVKKVKKHKHVTATMRDNALQKIQNIKNRLGMLKRYQSH